jgi:uncharacterized protein with GYD domain
MPIFILMTRLAPEDLHDAKARRAIGKEWLNKVHQTCPEVTFLAHYALLGPYDSMDIYEAPDVETAHQVSLISRAEGALNAESWPAIPYEKQLELLASIEG